MLLLCSTLGDESCRPLSYAQFRTLAERARALGPGGADLRRDLTAKDLTRLGYAPEEAERIEDLLSREAALHAYLSAAERRSIFPLTRITPGYPAALRALLGDRAPLVLFLRGEPSLLELPCISVVGSRQPNERTRGFARRIGALAAKEGFVLCSGGAGGVDTEAEDACLGGGGRVIVFPAGRLTDCRVDARVLYLTEGAYDVPFSAQRALARNRLIHAAAHADRRDVARLHRSSAQHRPPALRLRRRERGRPRAPCRWRIAHRLAQNALCAAGAAAAPRPLNPPA